MALDQCERLIEDISSVPLMSLQCIHISHALLHLIVSSIDDSVLHRDKHAFGDLLEEHGLQWYVTFYLF
jgi:hypothetical protein